MRQMVRVFGGDAHARRMRRCIVVGLELRVNACRRNDRAQYDKTWATMLEKLGFQELIERHVTIKRVTKSMPGFRFVMAMILTLYVGWSRLNHLQFLQREPMLTGILGVEELPVQSTFWRFLGSLHLVVARQLLEVTRRFGHVPSFLIGAVHGLWHEAVSSPTHW